MTSDWIIREASLGHDISAETRGTIRKQAHKDEELSIPDTEHGSGKEPKQHKRQQSSGQGREESNLRSGRRWLRGGARQKALQVERVNLQT